MAQGTKSPPPAPAMAPSNGAGNAPAPAAVNRKKQKRREKEAAKEAAKKAAEAHRQGPEPSRNGLSPPAHGHAAPLQPQADQHAPRYEDPDLEDPTHYDDGDYYSDEDEDDDEDDDDDHYDQPYGTNGDHLAAYSAAQMDAGGAGKKTRRKNTASSSAQQTPYHSSLLARNGSAPSMPQAKTGGKKDHIWNTSTNQERERIREFWLSLGEEERKSLVKIEKEAVLRKMKEQQKHSCSCTVCGRKRTAIEEELEVLYDAYYEELEQYANQSQEPGPMLPPARYPHPAHALRGSPHTRRDPHPPADLSDEGEDLSQGEEEDGDQDYSNSEISSDEDYSSEERTSLPPPEADFLQFGSSLQVKGGILTVADDLLKNDGKKFIEMMEQLAERRMQREEEAQFQSHPGIYGGRPHPPHNHGPPPEEDEFDDEEDEDEEGYENDDYEDEEEEDDTMTEEQRMEEGRRMFQIFAARMFEQRVLQAYKEKVAAERQQKLLEEEEEDEQKEKQRELKKAKEAQKRKEKKEKQKQVKAEEKARKDAEQAAKEAEVKAAEEKRLEEQRRKKDEQRRKKDLERKSQEEEKQRKEAEKLKRQQEERERHQELERKQREVKAQEKKAKDEARRKEREEREAKEKEAREKKAHDDKERRERDSRIKAEKDRIRKEEQAAAAIAKKAAQPLAVALPPGLMKQTSSAGVPSPHVTPALPKAPTPNRPRQTSQQGSHGSSPKTPHIPLGTSKSMSPASQIQNPIVPKSILTKMPTSQQQTPIHNAQSTSPMLPIGPPPGMHGLGMGGMNMPPGLNGFPHSPMMPPGMTGPHHGMGHNMQMYSPQPGSQPYRGFLPQGVHSSNTMPIGRGFPSDVPPGFPGLPAFGGPSQMPPFGMGMPAHSRQPSGSFDKPNMESPAASASAQPIQRPTPIGRPGSVKPYDDNRHLQFPDLDELPSHLGSKALCDGAEVLQPSEPRRTSLQNHGSLRGGGPLGFGFADTPGQTRTESYPFGASGNNSMWSTPTMPFPMPGAPGWGNSPTSGGFHPFSILGGATRPGEQRIVWIRRMLCTTCKSQALRQPTPDGYLDAADILQQMESFSNPTELPITLPEIKDACDIFGDQTNGGGSLEYKEVASNTSHISHIRFVEAPAPNTALGALGEIGSPIPGHSVPAIGGFSARPFLGLGPKGF